MTLEKQLDIERDIKTGALNMIRVYSESKGKRNQTLLSEAEKRFMESKAKVDILFMKITTMKNEISYQHLSDPIIRSASENIGKSIPFHGSSGSSKCRRFKFQISQCPEAHIALLRYKIGVESRLIEGAESILKVSRKIKKSGNIVSLEIYFLQLLPLFCLNFE